MTAKLKEDITQFVLIIYHGTTPLPGTPEWESLSKEEQQSAYTDYDARSSPGSARGRDDRDKRPF
jgi:hypothetical protein